MATLVKPHAVKFRDPSIVPNYGEYDPKRMEKFTMDDLENMYSGGKCYELALALRDYDPKRFTLWEITMQQPGEKGKPRPCHSGHWVVKDKTTGKFVDIYGNFDTLDDLLEGWDVLEEDLNIKYFKRRSRIKAVWRIHKGFRMPGVAAAFQPWWREDALHVAKRAGII